MQLLINCGFSNTYEQLETVMVRSRTLMWAADKYAGPHATDLVTLITDLHEQLETLEETAHSENKKHHEAIARINALANDIFANRVEGKLGEAQDFVPVNVAPCL